MVWNVLATLGMMLGMFILIINNDNGKTMFGYIVGVGLVCSSIAVLAGY